MGLEEAREKLDDVRKQLAANIDPSQQRKAQKASLAERVENTFEAIAREWFTLNSPKWQSTHGHKTIRRLEINVFPWIGERALREVTAPELLSVIRRIEVRNANETAHRTLQACGRVFRYAIATGRAERDPSRDLAGALAPVIERHHASITDPKGVGALLRAIEAYNGSFTTKCALRLAALLFVPPMVQAAKELTRAEWKRLVEARRNAAQEPAKAAARELHLRKRRLQLVERSVQQAVAGQEARIESIDVAFAGPIAGVHVASQSSQRLPRRDAQTSHSRDLRSPGRGTACCRQRSARGLRSALARTGARVK